MRMRFGLSLVGALLLCGAASAAAQGTTSRVVGTVADSGGGNVPGATVTLTNEATGVSFNTVSNEAGSYSFEAVQVGQYTLTVELQGFKKFVSTNNPVNIGDPATINATLTPGGVAESVEVHASSQIVQTSTSGNLGTTFDQRTIESLPILGGRGRNPLDLVLTQPGVVSGANTGGGVHVNGARDRSWNFTLDGIDTNESSAGGSNFSPLRTNPDALAEFKVITGNTTAEYGRNSGGQVAMITRSGTNSLTGTAFYFDRRPEYNANEWQNNIDHLPKAAVHAEDARVQRWRSDPAQQNFLFREHAVAARGSDPRAHASRLHRRRAARHLPVRDRRTQPAGGRRGRVRRRERQGDCSDRLVQHRRERSAAPRTRSDDPDAVGLTPLPNNFTSGDGLNIAGYTFVAPEYEQQMDFVAKIDHTFSSRHAAFVRISKGHQNTNCDSVNGGEPAFPGLPCLVDTTRIPYNWAGNWRWSPARNIVNELVVGQNHFTFDFLSPRQRPVAADVEFRLDHDAGGLHGRQPARRSTPISSSTI